MRSIGLALALACAMLPLAAGLAQEDTSAGTVAPPLSQPRTSALPWLKLEDLIATRERPLFAIDRRPQAPVPPPLPIAPQQSAKQRPDFPPNLPLAFKVERRRTQRFQSRVSVEAAVAAAIPNTRRRHACRFRLITLDRLPRFRPDMANLQRYPPI